MGNETSKGTQSSSAPVQEYSEQEVKAFLLAQVADIRDCSVTDIQTEGSSSGDDIEIDSQEAMAAISAFENLVGRNIINAEDLTRDNFRSLNSITKLVSQRNQTDAA